MKQINKKNEKGFTMIELIIVVAIMAIIGAVLVPMFGDMSNKARLTSDVTSVKTLQKQFELYKVEQGKYPDGFVAATDPKTTAVEITPAILKELVDKNYIDNKDLTNSGDATKYALKLQTAGTLKAVNGRCFIEVGSTTVYGKLITDLPATDNTKDWFVIK